MTGRALASDYLSAIERGDLPPGGPATQSRVRLRLLGGPNLQPVAANGQVETWLTRPAEIAPSAGCARAVMP